MARRLRTALARLGRLSVAVAALSSAAACADELRAVELRWPTTLLGAPTQPVGQASGLQARLEAMRWEPEGVVVELGLDNLGPGTLRVDLDALMLAWDGLEYSRAERGSSRELALDEGAGQIVRLRYRLGRGLIGSDAWLVVRGLEREGVAAVELPTLALPAKPAGL
ncbi:hypothetical protein G6O69_04955 [Pseudenhygromyxa sp. WMMC2535]|uniref:hypothetical protein n=1 Tax=Pseudenhygromyxa sp. WMMC2535 TaxID=2712867 RepID=UPI0015558F30|nr:hypothetical protein [Pseudenhygromyxa sp. WMMC2535]NVB37169.1 hypothetical protein [Pseudenhygromyxa sp. WMMC2535]